MGSTAVLLIGWRAILYKILLNDKRKTSDVYRRGNPFELFEVWSFFFLLLNQCIEIYNILVIAFLPCLRNIFLRNTKVCTVC